MRLWQAACHGAAGHTDEARAALAAFLAAAREDMARFPGESLAAWEPHLHGAVEYRDPAEFDHLRRALRAAGLS